MCITFISIFQVIVVSIFECPGYVHSSFQQPHLRCLIVLHTFLVHIFRCTVTQYDSVFIAFQHFLTLNENGLLHTTLFIFWNATLLQSIQIEFILTYKWRSYYRSWTFHCLSDVIKRTSLKLCPDDIIARMNASSTLESFYWCWLIASHVEQTFR